MALRKPVLIRFLENKRNKLTREVGEEILVATREAKIRTLNKRKDQCELFFRALRNVIEINERLVKNYIEDGLIYKGHYSCLNSTIVRELPTTEENLMDKFLYQFEVPMTEEDKKKVKVLEAKRNDIDDNYGTLICYCNSLKSGKQIEKYLEDLGFDLTDLKKKQGEYVSTELVPQIDKDKLFIGGLK